MISILILAIKVKNGLTETEDGVESDWKFANMKFTQSEVETALTLKHTKVQGDRSLFDPKTLSKFPEISAWLENPQGEYASKFASMSVKQFNDYKANIEARTAGKLKKLGKQKQTRRQIDSDDDESGEEVVVRHKKRKNKTLTRHSDDLDSDE